MNKLPLLLAATVASVALLPVACGDDASSSGAGGSGGSGGAGTTSSSVTVGPTSTSTGTAACDGSDYGDPCGPCLEESCCAELAESGGEVTQELFDCASASCNAECIPPEEEPLPNPACEIGATLPAAGACGEGLGACNPVTQSGCNAAGGEACDFGSNGFQCYPTGNVQNLCEECGASDDDYCLPGHTCAPPGQSATGVCFRFCCVDADCGTGTCAVGAFPSVPDLGICAEGGGGGGGGMGGAGGAGGMGGAGGAGGAM